MSDNETGDFLTAAQLDELPVFSVIFSESGRLLQKCSWFAPDGAAYWYEPGEGGAWRSTTLVGLAQFTLLRRGTS